MSLHITTYVMLGVILPYPGYFDDEAAEKLFEDHGCGYYDTELPDGVAVIGDHMDGNWCAVGKVYARSWAGDNGALPHTVSIPTTTDKAAVAEIAAFITEHGLNQDKLGYKIGWHVVVQYS